MKERTGGRLGALSVLSLLVAAAMVLGGLDIAGADTTATWFQSIDTGAWNPPAPEPSGAAYLGSGDLLVVDTNNNNGNGWVLDTATNGVTTRATGLAEQTGVHYDPGTNTLFLTSDNGTLRVIRNYGTSGQSQFDIDTEAPAIGSFDTEDPAFNADNGHLYWVDGGQATIYDIDPGANGIIDASDSITEHLIADLGVEGPDWEALAWDPQTSYLLLGNTREGEIYRLDVTGSSPALVDTIHLPGFESGWISGLGMAQASFDSSKWTLWVTDRNTASIHEFTIDGTVPPTTTTSTTTSSTTTTSQPTTTSTTSPTTTSTTQPTTTTTTQPTTTTTTSPTTTSTTQPTTTTTTSPTTTSTTQPTTTTTTPTTPTTQPPSPPAGSPPDNPFVDAQGHLFQTAIVWMADQGITEGCNPPDNDRFCPDDYVTRAQMAAFLLRAKGYAIPAPGDYFVDDDGTLFESAINKLRAAGVTQGCNPPANDRFCPDDYVTRAQMAAFLLRTFDFSAQEGTDDNQFVDDDDSVFENAIQKLWESGVTQGCNPPDNDRFCPDDYVTRAQMAAFMRRALGL